MRFSFSAGPGPAPDIDGTPEDVARRLFAPDDVLRLRFAPYDVVGFPRDLVRGARRPPYPAGVAPGAPHHALAIRAAAVLGPDDVLCADLLADVLAPDDVRGGCAPGDAERPSPAAQQRQ